MNNNLKVLKLFADNKDKSFSINKAAQSLHLNYRIAYQEAIKLNAEQLIQMTKHGNINLCSFKYTYHHKVVELEEIRKQEVFKHKDLKLIYTRIKEIKNPFYCLLLFGSYAHKTNQKGSDIDLCLISDNEKTTTEIHSLLSIIPLPIHLQAFTSEQFLHMIKSKELNVGNEIVENNIILYGLEAFYGMVHHAR